MKTKTILPILLSLSLTQLFSQKGKELPASTFTIGINHDNVFGFYPAAYGSFGVKENLSFTYYSILWTNPSFASATNGTDSWLETGFGLSKEYGGGKWLINPSIGLTHGKLLSGGTEGVISDGIVPSGVVFFQDGVMELEAFGAWYKALRKKGLFTYDYVLYWLLPGFAINERLSAGLHFEGFSLTSATNGSSEALYQVVGAYAKFTAAGKYMFRLSLGKNFKESDYPDEFYKLTLIIPFI